MTYPFAGFGTFIFQRSEWPLPGTDHGWNRDPSYDQSRPMGSTRDSIVTLAIGSASRSFECHLSPDRFAVLEAMVNTTATFVDWERPTPGSRSAFLQSVEQVDWVAVECPDSSDRTQKRIRTRVNLVSQDIV